MCKVSIIIPVYNTDRYLGGCIDSILSQTFTDFELLLINDGSTDGSGTICDCYAAQDSRIRVFHKENGGVSSARNLGLDNAKGEWVCFVDSDDELMPGGLKAMVGGVTDDVDLVMGEYEEVDTEGNAIQHATNHRLTRLNKTQSLVTMYAGYGPNFHYWGYVSIRLFRKSIIAENSIRFDTNISIKEDTLFVVQYVCQSNGITALVARPVYRYFRRPDSAMGKVECVFEYNYVTSFDAVVEMKREVKKAFPFYSEVVFVAKQAIVCRYWTIVGMMDTHGVEDMELRSKLDKEMSNEVGPMLFFKLRRKWRKITKRHNRYIKI